MGRVDADPAFLALALERLAVSFLTRLFPGLDFRLALGFGFSLLAFLLLALGARFGSLTLLFLALRALLGGPALFLLPLGSGQLIRLSFGFLLGCLLPLPVRLRLFVLGLLGLVDVAAPLAHFHADGAPGGATAPGVDLEF
jgi:hypothetical protein